VVTSEILKKGTLGKLSTGIIKRWQTRYFVIAGHYLNYTEDEAHAQQHGAIKATIDLHACTDVTVSDTKISLTIGGKVQQLKAANVAEASAWAEVMRTIVADNRSQLRKASLTQFSKSAVASVATGQKVQNSPVVDSPVAVNNFEHQSYLKTSYERAEVRAEEEGKADPLVLKYLQSSYARAEVRTTQLNPEVQNYLRNSYGKAEASARGVSVEVLTYLGSSFARTLSRARSADPAVRQFLQSSYARVEAREKQVAVEDPAVRKYLHSSYGIAEARALDAVNPEVRKYLYSTYSRLDAKSVAPDVRQYLQASYGKSSAKQPSPDVRQYLQTSYAAMAEKQPNPQVTQYLQTSYAKTEHRVTS
jgi:hypothetical protein